MYGPKPKVIIRPGMMADRLRIVRISGRQRGAVLWECICICRKGTVLHVRASRLREVLLGKVNHMGCGCRTDGNGPKETHGLSKTREYAAWCGMRERCYDKDSPQYHRYGGRGIRICDRWLDSFETFYKDMGKRPSPHHSIDRVDNDGDYAPDNCRWATNVEQQRNMKTNHNVTFRGKRQCVTAWAEEFGLDITRFRNYVKRHGFVGAVKMLGAYPT